MSLLRSIVVDDEPLARELVEGYVNQTPFLESAGSYPDALSAMEAIRNGMQAELLFLDIQMPNLSGLELSRLLPPEMKVIFITAFEQYAVIKMTFISASKHSITCSSRSAMPTSCRRPRKHNASSNWNEAWSRRMFPSRSGVSS